MDGATWGDIAQAAITTILPLVLAYIFSRSGRAKHGADTARKWQEVADVATDEVVELRAERDELRATVASLRAELAQVREGSG